MTEITFNELPQAVSRIYDKLESLERLFQQRNSEPQPEPDELLTVPQAAEFLTLSVPTIYGLISKGELPVMKRSKRCYFSKVELIEYLKQGRKKTLAETGREAEAYLNQKKKGVKNG